MSWDVNAIWWNRMRCKRTAFRYFKSCITDCNRLEENCDLHAWKTLGIRSVLIPRILKVAWLITAQHTLQILDFQAIFVTRHCIAQNPSLYSKVVYGSGSTQVNKSVSESQAQLTGGLTDVLSWLHANFLILNLKKTTIMLVGTHQRITEADGVVIEISNAFRKD